ncbi:hypothetical protein DK853_48705, partial [Klebsiella oxytoca]
SSRYALQFQVGVLGILLTFALMWKIRREEEAEEKKQQKRDRWRNMEKAVAAVIIAVFLVGNGYTTYREIRMT